MNQEVNELIDPLKFRDQIDIDGIEKTMLIDMLRKMILIRKAEEKLSEHVESGKIKCPCHLGIGQEAIGVAVALIMKKTDRAFGAHRSHAHFLALNENTYSLFAEVLGKYDGCSHGMGGSMHIVDNENGFKGSVPIVGATIPIATGAGLAAKMDKGGDIAISYFGDGSCEEGVFHESLNMASIMNLPVLYVCENNLFASHLHIDLLEKAQGRGIGKAMMNLVLDSLRDQGSKGVHLGMGAQNSRAFTFYTKLGFSLLDKSEDEWTMGLKL